MFQIKYFILVFLLLLSPIVKSDGPIKYKLKKVVIDAGHGGKDPGASGKKIKEKDVALLIALKLGALIEKNIPEVQVVYTRKTDVFVELDKRAEIANKCNADLFISIHLNSNPNKKMIGAETYVMGLHRADENLDVSERENSVILVEDDYSTRYEGFDPKSAESLIIFSLVQKTFLEQSLLFAEKVEYQFRNRGQRTDRGVKQAGLVVLWKTAMPGVLIEVGYLSNLTEEKYLASTKGQDMLASCIYRAFREYKKNIESKSSMNAGTNDNNSDEEDVVFKVQIARSTKSLPLNSASFKGLADVEEFHADGIYRYFVGSETNFDKILEKQKKVREKIPDAFSVAFKNGKIVPIKQVVKDKKK